MYSATLDISLISILEIQEYILYLCNLYRNP
nr:MAG TPA: hypothetical protein [Caudoviricetes sp.]